MAAKKHVSVAEVAASIVATGGPKSSGTVAEACKFYDDKVFGSEIYRFSCVWVEK